MKKVTFDINRESLLRLGIDPEEGILYLESKNANDLNPAHVKALQILKQKPTIASS